MAAGEGADVVARGAAERALVDQIRRCAVLGRQLRYRATAYQQTVFGIQFGALRVQREVDIGGCQRVSHRLTFE